MELAVPGEEAAPTKKLRGETGLSNFRELPPSGRTSGSGGRGVYGRRQPIPSLECGNKNPRIYPKGLPRGFQAGCDMDRDVVREKHSSNQGREK